MSTVLSRAAPAQRRGWRATEGSSTPQGVSWIADERAFNFALYSKHATRVTLMLYGDADPATPVLVRPLDPLSRKTGRIWHCRLSEEDVGEARYYAYSVDGPPPTSRVEWHAFDPDKVLLDPYARAIHFPPDFDRDAARQPGSNAGKAPLGVIHAGSRRFPGGDEVRPRHEADAIIYELHVRGFTRSASSGVAPERRGTFLGLVDRIPYLRELGITVVELMPVFQFDPDEGNYWGYMPLSFMAPHHAYAVSPAPEDRLDEFHTLVSALHDAGIEVVLDVVYNHTTEGDHRGPVYSLKGIDNSTYYFMTGDRAHPYADYAGTGNTLHTANRYVRKLITDSLRFWADELHVDGFRFDLASVFARGAEGGVAPEDFGVFGDILADPRLTDLRLIAEPWDACESLLGRALPGVTWAQWNARFRDDVRRFLRGDAGMVGALMRRLYGSDDLFPDDPAEPRHPYQSVNYVTAHDGYTLYDLVSYERKHNEANGLDNRDGPAHEYSWNCGWEGDDGASTDVVALRRRQARNFCALLLLANGTPMIRAGDEFLQTQGGNTNPFNQDNETSWLDWGRLEEHADVFRFFRLMIAFRKAHPTLARSRFWRNDIQWYGPSGGPDMGADSRTLAFLLSGAAQQDDAIYVMVNGGPTSVRFTVQEGPAEAWLRVVDTGCDSPDDIREPGQEAPLLSASCDLEPHSVVILLRPQAG